MIILGPRFEDVGYLLKSLAQQRVPGQLVIQLTDRCNALCPQCGMRKTETFARSTLPVDEVKRILDAAGQNGVKVVSFTGGEPLLLPNELETLIHHAGQAGIKYIRTGTNGFIFANSDTRRFTSRVTRLAERLAATPLRNFWISIDSAVPAVHEAMRGLPGVLKGIEKALPIFHEHGIYPSANLGINRNVGGSGTKALARDVSPGDGFDPEVFYETFRMAFREFYRFVIDLGFTLVNSCYPMSANEDPAGDHLRPVYAATSKERLVRFSRDEKAWLFKAALDVISEFRPKIRIFSPQSSLYALCRQYTTATNGRPYGPYPCRGGIDYFFVDCKEGNTYPCGYRGHENLGKYWDMHNKGQNSSLICHQCDWECFRDPSELFGPLLELTSKPLALLRRATRDGHYFRLWMRDLKYYQACDLFHGRKPPNQGRLRRFESPGF